MTRRLLIEELQPARSAVTAAADARATGVTGSPHAFVALLNHVLCPVIAVGSLASCAAVYREVFSSYYFALAVLVFFLSLRLLDDVDLFAAWSEQRLIEVTRTLLVRWLGVVALLLVLGYVGRMVDEFHRQVIVTWIAVTPLLQLLGIMAARIAVRRLIDAGAATRRAVIVGANHTGQVFASRLGENPHLSTRVTGFFDDRSSQRVGLADRLLGKLADVPDFVRKRRIDCVYISLPMAAQPRVLQLTRALRDTTASVYFLPDFLVFDAIQARFDYCGGMPVAAIRETPHYGAKALVKRAMDLMLSVPLLVLAAPVMLLIAAGIKLDSRGPVLFRQRRYGIDGQEIVIYKFRTMTVCEDGERVTQARRGDARVTRFGALLRRTSLDELPQLLNVLAGTMSIVGPRPHAVAHNEQYRKLVPGYMLRHKVKPGITGWAQVNGFRGETDSLEKMHKRVEMDLNYLDNWSPWLDLWIVLKTATIVWKDANAY